ncbi:MAG: phosphate acyltransferase PlsX [Thermoleophilia bacterium]|nr:phosphate acyltransferase PlsX [Thermoleophilia bacterium]
MAAHSRPPATVTVALDAMGGDHAPAEPVRGALSASQDDIRVLLVGDREVLTAALAAEQAGESDRIQIVHAPDVVTSAEDGARAVRAKPESSVAVGCRLVKEGQAQAIVSPGHTGATLAASILYLRRVPGVLRPGIGVILPNPEGPVVLIDAGANAEARPEHLRQFALMGRLFARDVLGVASPSVGLLSIGEEGERGSDLVLESHALLRGSPGFVGNIEGRDILTRVADVVVTDGFTGNVALKLMEGTAVFMLEQIRAAVTSSLIGRIGGLLVRPSLRAMREKTHPDTYGGAYLLGVRGISVIGHGNGRSRAVANAIRLAARGVRSDLVSRLAEGIDQENRHTADPEG